MKTLFLIRHGKSVTNEDKSLHYSEDIVEHAVTLSPTGIDQAKACGLRLKPHLARPFTAMVSPYLRASQTLEQILSQQDTKPVETIIDGRLREQEFRAYKNEQDYLTEGQIRRAKGKLYHRAAGGESGYDVLNRVGGFYNQLRTDWMLSNREDTVVIVCHEIVVRVFFMLLLDLPPQDFEDMIVDNCQINTFCADEKLKFRKVKFAKLKLP
jgi:broad specificity phosphatase PhoE